MSPVLLALSICTFALGFAEFVAVSLIPSIAADTGMPVGAIGLMVGIYALGVSIGAPTLSASLARFPRRGVLAASMLLFAAANLFTAYVDSLTVLLATRLIAGLMHGVVLALAASTAVAAAGPGRSGNAVSNVFAGLTVALMTGVPLGTFAGSHFAWQYAFIAIAVIAMLGTGMLAFFMQSTENATTTALDVRTGAAGTVYDRSILYSTAITALAYTGSFTGFTYVSVLLERQTHLGAAGITAMFTLYGAAAAAGNALGGRFMDRVGARYASLAVFATLALALGGAWTGAASATAMAVVMVVWGAASFGAVPVLQTAVLLAAKRNPAASPEIASGMNIAAFNLGITAGSAIGGYVSLVSVQMPMLAGLVPLAAGAAMAWRLPGRPAIGRTFAAR